MITLRSVFYMVALLLAVARPGFASLPEKRVALLIGNSNYGDDNKVSGVENAKAMEGILKQLGFKVFPPVLDKRMEDTTDALDAFTKEIKDASLVLFFYSGHGFQMDGKSYLRPIGGGLSQSSSLALTDVLQKLAAAPDDAIKLVFVDACRTSKNRPAGMKPGLAQPHEGAGPPRLVQAFAAGANQEASAGSADSLSPYTLALLDHIREPGLSLLDLLAQVHEQVIRTSYSSQQPTEAGLGGVPKDFYLRPPVFVRAALEEADDDLVGVLNGEIAFNRDALKQGSKSLRLRAGHNPLLLLVSNQATRHNGHSWERTEGWKYTLRLFGPGGTELTAPGCNWKKPCFFGYEEIPFKDGPHHGNVFEVATADLYVDPVSGQLELRDVKTQAWDTEAPFWARQQDSLFEVPLKRFPVGEMMGLGPETDITVVATNIQRLLSQLGLGAVKLPDFDRILAVVRGNRRFTNAVKACMEDHRAERIADLTKSFQAAKAGEKRPFDSFDSSLTACVREVELSQTSPAVTSEDIRVWTAFEDRSQ